MSEQTQSVNTEVEYGADVDSLENEMTTEMAREDLHEQSVDDLIGRVRDNMGKIQESFDAISQPRSDFQIEHFVISQHETPERRFQQCVLELQSKSSSLRRSHINRERLLRSIERLEAKIINPDPDDVDNDYDLDLKEKYLGLAEIELAIKGSFREFMTLYNIWSGMKKFEYAELQAAEADYWKLRLTRQAQQERLSTGRVGVGNLDAIRQGNFIDHPLLLEKDGTTLNEQINKNVEDIKTEHSKEGIGITNGESVLRLSESESRD